MRKSEKWVRVAWHSHGDSYERWMPLFPDQDEEEEPKPMGKNPCPVCATPQSTILGQAFHCSGCGLHVPLKFITAYIKRDKQVIPFDRATSMYETLKSTVPFGEWLMRENYELAAKP